MWAGPEGDLGLYVSDESQKMLDAYRAQPNLVRADATREQDTTSGGYRHRQLFELVQNGADALWSREHDPSAQDEPAAGNRGSDGSGSPGPPAPPAGHESPEARGGQIEVRLVEDCLYCADNGEPIDCEGVTALMFPHMSTKRGTDQIGTFGLGFTSVLGVSDSPEFFSRSGSFGFDRQRSREWVQAVVPNVESFPVLSLPEPIDPAACFGQDDVLWELMGWATNIVRLPLKSGTHEDCSGRCGSFPQSSFSSCRTSACLH